MLRFYSKKYTQGHPPGYLFIPCSLCWRPNWEYTSWHI